MAERHEQEARAFIEELGLTPERCYLAQSGDGYVLVMVLPDGQE